MPRGEESLTRDNLSETNGRMNDCHIMVGDRGVDRGFDENLTLWKRRLVAGDGAKVRGLVQTIKISTYSR